MNFIMNICDSGQISTIKPIKTVLIGSLNTNKAAPAAAATKTHAMNTVLVVFDMEFLREIEFAMNMVNGIGRYVTRKSA
jgi:hypothetical protein